MNKNKYFEVTTTSVVSAINMAEARRAAASRSKVDGTHVLGRSTSVDRIYAEKAKTLAESLTSNWNSLID